MTFVAIALRGCILLAAVTTVATLTSTAGAATLPFTVQSVINASNFTIGQQDGATTIFGGLAGDASSTTCISGFGGNTLCNNCFDNLTACNETRVQDSLRLRINFRVNQVPNAPLWFGFKKGAALTQWVRGTDFDTSFAIGNLPANTDGFVEVEWSDICQGAFGASCNSGQFTSDFSLVIGAGATEPATTARIDIRTLLVKPTPSSGNSENVFQCDDVAPSAGVCSFEAYPGDQKIFVREVFRGESGYPQTAGGVNLRRIRIFYGTSGFTALGYLTPTFADLTLSADGEGVPSPGRIEGLTNETLYFFKPAVIDEANNIAFLLEDNAIFTPFPGCGPGPADDAQCPLTATPSQVLGLLTEDMNCFISTAAYGSTQAPQVNVFREFRNRFLVPSRVGQKLIRLYYDVGPKAARAIATSEVFRAAARTSLWPVLAYAQVSLALGSPLFAGMIFLFAALLLSALVLVAFIRPLRSKIGRPT
jgi:hypothetical protein